MKKMLLIILLFSLFSGCWFSHDNCENYCDGNILYECEQSQGGIGWSDNWYEWDCSEDGKICTSEYGAPGCYYDASKCKDGVTSFCNGKTIFRCDEKSGNIYANPYEDCLTGEVCVEFSDDSICAVPVEECDPQAFKVCINNVIGNCYENDGKFYAIYDKSCGEEECVELGDGTVNCLVPVDECDPQPYKVCVNNMIGNCYEKDGEFYATYDESCGEEECVELDNGNANCFIPVETCNPEAQSVCNENIVTRCYKISDNYYVVQGDDCKDKTCLYDPYTMSAECI